MSKSSAKVGLESRISIGWFSSDASFTLSCDPTCAKRIVIGVSGKTHVRKMSAQLEFCHNEGGGALPNGLWKFLSDWTGLAPDNGPIPYHSFKLVEFSR